MHLRTWIEVILAACVSAGVAADAQPVSTAQVIQVRWPTSHAAAPFSGTAIVRPEWLGLFRASVASFPEETVIAGCLAQGQFLGLATNDALRLQGLFADYYKRLRQSESFRAVPSALSFCFSERKPAQGLATVYVPAQLKPCTPTIIFLHGFGGSLIAYLHYLAETFPDHLIVCPAYGVSPATIPYAYVNEAQKAVADRLKTKTERPVLMGLSAGGWGACRIYVQKPDSFRRLVVLAAFPPEDIRWRWNNTSDARFLCGAKEDYVANGTLRNQLNTLKPRTKDLDWKTIAGGDHFFFFSHEEQTKRILKDWFQH